MSPFYSNGKLLITGEYLVLDGASALALPTKFGQSLKVSPIDEPKIIWKSFDDHENIWFSGEFDLKMRPLDCSFDRLRMTARDDKSDSDISKRLIQILKAAKQLNPDFLTSGFTVETHLDFPRNWGLGTSSTLINNIANWAHVDAYKLLELTFGGSGYDIACAQHDNAITYRVKNTEILNQHFDKLSVTVQNDKKELEVDKVDFNPSFSENLFFIHLNKKQDSRQGIAQYKSKKGNLKKAISEVNSITKQMIHCKKLSEFETLINQHEQLISSILETPTVKDLLFKDYKGAIKSLGAWGGDFILVTGTYDDMDYFKNKGYQTIISFDDMIL